jgi:hypothetical protein
LCRQGFGDQTDAFRLQRIARFYFNNVIGNPFDTTIALHYPIFDGVLERHSNLKILAMHGGGYLPAYSGRIDHARGARSDVKGDLPKPPPSYLKKIYFRHGRVHAASARRARAPLQCPHHHGDRLSLRHGRI